MSLKTQVDFILSQLCSTYRVEPTWVKAIIEVESAWNPYAIRYEPQYPYHFETSKCAKRARVTLATELATQRMSWGLGQVMGALAREQGHQGSMAELTQPELNLKHMCIRLKDLNQRAASPAEVFAAYNGGPGAMKRLESGLFLNQTYVDKVKGALKNYD